jgi:hypothetical protein
MVTEIQLFDSPALSAKFTDDDVEIFKYLQRTVREFVMYVSRNYHLAFGGGYLSVYDLFFLFLCLVM